MLATRDEFYLKIYTEYKFNKTREKNTAYNVVKSSDDSQTNGKCQAILFVKWYSVFLCHFFHLLYGEYHHQHRTGKNIKLSDAYDVSYNCSYTFTGAYSYLNRNFFSSFSLSSRHSIFRMRFHFVNSNQLK